MSDQARIGIAEDRDREAVRYPVGVNRRIGAAPVLAPTDGCATGTAKLAFIEGRFVLDGSLSATPIAASGYRLRSAASAFGLLRSNAGKEPPTPALEVRRVELGTATFETDRAGTTLPAWMFFFRGVEHPAAVLALAGSEVFEPPRQGV